MEAVKKANGIMVCSADHGNSDDMCEVDKKTGELKLDDEGKFLPKTAHSLNPVPAIVYDPSNASGVRLAGVQDPGHRQPGGDLHLPPRLPATRRLHPEPGGDRLRTGETFNPELQHLPEPPSRVDPPDRQPSRSLSDLRLFHCGSADSGHAPRDGKLACDSPAIA